jgi:hypothetical protein
MGLITGTRHFSLDHLVGDRQERRRDHESQRFCRLEIDHKLELCRAFDGQVGGLGALKDLVDEPGGASKRLNQAGPVGHEATSRCFVAQVAHDRYSALERSLRHLNTVGEEHRPSDLKNAVRAIAGDRLEGAGDLLGDLYLDHRLKSRA